MIIRFLNDDAAKTFLKSDDVIELVRQHAEFSTGDAPIYVWTEQTTAPPTDSTEDEDAPASETPETVSQWKRVNDQAPVWMRYVVRSLLYLIYVLTRSFSDPKSVTDEEYKGFYKAAFKSDSASEALLWSHFKVKFAVRSQGDDELIFSFYRQGDAGATEFRSLIYVPSAFNPDIFQQTYQALNSVKLYVRRVFITSDLGVNFIPKWMNWLKVIVDADDLPLNVGRDSLQNNPSITQIKRTVIRKVCCDHISTCRALFSLTVLTWITGCRYGRLCS